MLQLVTHAPPVQLAVVFGAVVVHVVGAPHIPTALHAWTVVVLAHIVVLGTHMPLQAPGGVFTVPRHASVHGVVASVHIPPVLHVSRCVSLAHATAPGEQTPVHFPPTQAWFVQTLPQAPQLLTVVILVSQPLLALSSQLAKSGEQLVTVQAEKVHASTA